MTVVPVGEITDRVHYFALNSLSVATVSQCGHKLHQTVTYIVTAWPFRRNTDQTEQESLVEFLGVTLDSDGLLDMLLRLTLEQPTDLWRTPYMAKRIYSNSR